MTDSPLMYGTIVRSEGGFHTVQTGDARLLCTLVKRLRQGERTDTNPVAIGDVAGARDIGGGQGVIEELAPRRNALVRRAPGRNDLRHVLAANLDQLAITSSLHQPPANRARLDRFLVIAEQDGIPATVVVSKVDLGSMDEARAIFDLYEQIGYPVLYTSATTGLGIESVRMGLLDRTSTVVGASGVGKSSLLNAVQPGLRLRAGLVSERTGKGRHTTTVSELHPLDGGGYVADTPGLRGLEPFDLDPELLDGYFPEFRPFLGLCRFSPCSHTHEPGCAIADAVRRDRIAETRYTSYVKLYDEAMRNARPAWER